MPRIWLCTPLLFALIACGSPSSAGAPLPDPDDLVRITLRTGTMPKALAIGDFNGDGKPDLFVGHMATGDGQVYLAAGVRSLEPLTGSPVQVGREPSDAAAADLNADGKLDLIVANHET